MLPPRGTFGGVICRNCIVISTVRRVASTGLRSWGSAWFGRGGDDGAPRPEEAGCCCPLKSRRLSPPKVVPRRWSCSCCPEPLAVDHSPASWGSSATWPSHSGTTPAWTVANHVTSHCVPWTKCTTWGHVCVLILLATTRWVKLALFQRNYPDLRVFIYTWLIFLGRSPIYALRPHLYTVISVFQLYSNRRFENLCMWSPLGARWVLWSTKYEFSVSCLSFLAVYFE
jgi:hypothetical protein